MFPEPKPEPKAAEPAPAPVVVAPPPPPPPTPKIMVFEAAALFGVNKSEISPTGKEKIKEYRERARAELSSAKTIKITGHTDSSGKAEYNQKLSVKRAEAVRDYLISLGADASKMEVAGMGATKPIADNKTAAGRANNRRVEVEVTRHREVGEAWPRRCRPWPEPSRVPWASDLPVSPARSGRSV